MFRPSLEFFVHAWDDLHQLIRDPSTHVDDLCWRAVALLERAQGPVQKLRSKAQMKELLQLAADGSFRDVELLSPHEPRKELRTFLDGINPDIHADPLAAERNDPTAPDRGVTFSTVSASQGLQWPIVWAVGVSDHILPGPIPIHDARRMRDAQRLFYVWATRSEHMTIFCHAIRSSPTRDAKPCSFLEPIGDLLRHRLVPTPAPGV